MHRSLPLELFHCHFNRALHGTVTKNKQVQYYKQDTPLVNTLINSLTVRMLILASCKRGPKYLKMWWRVLKYAELHRNHYHDSDALDSRTSY